MGYLIEFPLAEDGFDESIKEAIEEILEKKRHLRPGKDKEILSKYNTPMHIEVELPPPIRLTQEEHKKILYNYKTEHNKMIRALFIEVLSSNLFVIPKRKIII